MAFSWSAGLLVLPWPGAFLHRYVGHDAPGDGHQGIYQLFATISGLKHIASKVSSAFGPATRVTALAWLPGAQVVIRVVSSGHSDSLDLLFVEFETDFIAIKINVVGYLESSTNP